MRLPRVLTRGTEITEAWFRELNAYLRSITLQPGTGYNRNWTPNGMSLDVPRRAPGGGGSEAFPGEAFKPNYEFVDGLTDDSKPWVKMKRQTWDISEDASGPSPPTQSNYVWRRKSDFGGRAMYFDA